MTRRARLRKIALRALLAILASAGCAPEPANLLLISLDTTRADRLSLYGHAKRTTPHLEELAGEGVKFAQAYSATATTGPSHATLFTSLHPYTHGLLKNGIVLGSRFETLAERLAAQGYSTHGVLGSYALSAKLGFDQGFASWDEDFEVETSSYEQRAWGGNKLTGGFDRPADDTTRRALAWLRTLDEADRPFFLFVHYFDPHDPYAPPERFRPEGEMTSLPAQVRALYDGEIEFMDEQIGVLLHGLRTSDLADETLVVVMGDHGEGLLERDAHATHGLHIYEEGVRVPLLMRLPGAIPAGTEIRAPFGAVDLLPTVLDLLAIDASDAQFQGTSIAESIRAGREPDASRPVYLTRRRYDPDRKRPRPDAVGEQHAIRLGRWKYFETPEEGPPELYDLEADPRERRNVAKQNAETTRELSRLLRAWRDEQRHDDSEPSEIPDDVRQKLEVMGYVE